MADTKQSAFPIVRGPGCEKPMRVLVTEVAPNDLNTVTYRCDICGTETQRTFKRPDK